MTTWRLFYHIIWASSGREPVIGSDVEPGLHREIIRLAIEMKTSIFAINGMPDHIHVVATIPATVAPFQLIERLKTGSAQFMQSRLDSPFAWEDGFGIVTVSRRKLRRVIEYVHTQKDRHLVHATVPALETSSAEDDGPDFDTPC